MLGCILTELMIILVLLNPIYMEMKHNLSWINASLFSFQGSNAFDFKIRGANSGDLLMTIGYSKDLRCFTGMGKQEDGNKVLTFTFFTKRSPLNDLQELME